MKIPASFLLTPVLGFVLLLAPARAADPAPLADGLTPEMRDLLAQLSRVAAASAKNEQSPADAMALLNEALKSLPQAAPAKGGQSAEVLAPLLEMLKMVSKLAAEDEPAPAPEPAPAANAPTQTSSGSSTQAPATAPTPAKPPLGSTSNLNIGTLTTGRLNGATLAPAALVGRGPGSDAPRLTSEEWRLLFPAP
jgi:hypothetical protein